MTATYWQSHTGSGFREAPSPPHQIFLILIGTGGHLDARRAQHYPAQNPTAPDPLVSRSAPLDVAPVVQSLADRVSAIKAAFGVTVSQLAQILQVQRQTIYDWMDEETPPQIQEQKRERLAAIQRWAIQWNTRCPWPAGKGITSYVVDGHTLLDLLTADVLDEARLTTLLRGLSEQVKAEWQQREERSVGEQACRRGFQSPSKLSLRSVLAGYGGAVSLTHDD